MQPHEGAPSPSSGFPSTMPLGVTPNDQYLTLADPLRFFETHRESARRLLIATTVGLLALSVFQAMQGNWPLGLTLATFVLCVHVNTAAFLSGKPVPVMPVAMVLPALALLSLTMRDYGMTGLIWAYPAILLFHFLASRATALLFDACVLVTAVTLAEAVLGPSVALRVGVTLTMTVAFTIMFSYINDNQRRRQNNQRQRLDLLVRGTHAGTLEWNGERNTVSYSPRLLQMLGYDESTDTQNWDFFDLVHPQDYVRTRQFFLRALRQYSRPNSMRNLAALEFRLCHSQGHDIWAHTESIVMTGPERRVTRLVSTFMDITERVKAEEALRQSHHQLEEQAFQLEEQNQALREAIRVREEVERIARHDLKTPLGSIASVPRLLRERRTLTQREDDLMGMVERAAYRVLSMVNLSLDLYRMEEGSYTLRARPVDLSAVVDSVLRDLRVHAGSKGVTLQVREPPQTLYAQAEELLCYSILANLLKNAVEASPDGGTVLITLEPVLEQASLSIHNQGAIPTAIRGSFFERYATHGKEGGTGLGAYSARLMARVQNGELLMRSSEEDGTTLVLHLPLGNAAEDHPLNLPQSADEGAATAVAWPALDVLLVDDDEYNVLVLRSMLPSPPLAVRVAVNGRAALNALTERRPDVVFLDLEMPVMGGMEALRQIRAMQRQRGDTPSTIIAFSAHDDEATRDVCLAAGFDTYLTKPATRRELFDVLSRQPSFPEPAMQRPRGAPVTGFDELPVAPSQVQVEPELRSMLPGFLESRRELAAEMEQALRHGDADKVRACAHKLAGSLGMYGLEWAGIVCRLIEKSAAKGQLDRLEPLVHSVVDHLVTVRVR